MRPRQAISADGVGAVRPEPRHRNRAAVICHHHGPAAGAYLGLRLCAGISNPVPGPGGATRQESRLGTCGCLAGNENRRAQIPQISDLHGRLRARFLGARPPHPAGARNRRRGGGGRALRAGIPGGVCPELADLCRHFTGVLRHCQPRHQSLGRPLCRRPGGDGVRHVGGAVRRLCHRGAGPDRRRAIG